MAGGRIRHNVACDHEGIEMSLCQQLEPSSEYMYAEPADNEYAMIPHYEPHTLNAVNEVHVFVYKAYTFDNNCFIIVF